MRVIISAGGTGGHIYPAISIINKLKERNKELEILYIGTTNRMEKDIIPSLGIKYAGIFIKGLNRKNIFKNIEVFKEYHKAKESVKDIITIFKPDVVVGVGGYVTLPVISVAKKLRIKTFIHEQNSILGLTNKILIRKADKVGISLKIDSLMKNDKVILTGNPRSEDAAKAKKMNKAKYGLNKNKKLVVIVMGSLGSMTITNIMKETLAAFKDKDYEVLFITGKDYFNQYESLKLPKNVKLLPTGGTEMLNILQSTDLIVTRAGATTIAEITTIGIPSIIIPSPHVTNNHQEYNASLLQEKGAAVIIKEKNLTNNILIKTIDSLIYDDKKLKEMKKCSKDLAVKDSATKVAKIIEKLAKEGKHGRNNKIHKRK